MYINILPVTLYWCRAARAAAAARAVAMATADAMRHTLPNLCRFAPVIEAACQHRM